MTGFIDTRCILPSSLATLGFGELFIPGRPAGEAFLAGTVGSHDLIMALTGQEPFHHAARSTWARDAGFCVKDIVFETDAVTSVSPWSITDEVGTLIIGNDALGIVGAHQFRKEIMWLGQEGAKADVVGFSSWRIGVGDPHCRTWLFSKSAP